MFFIKKIKKLKKKKEMDQMHDNKRVPPNRLSKPLGLNLLRILPRAKRQQIQSSGLCLSFHDNLCPRRTYFKLNFKF